MQLPSLPINHVIPEIKEALTKSSAVLAAPPGSGKTTIVPLALLDEPWLAGKKILILEPRRLATRAAASRMASLLDEKIGQKVGYQIRFDRRISQATRIEVLTEGILTRRIQSDPDLAGVGLIIFDEFHERSVHTDLALALCLDLCQLKDDLRLLVMSATLDSEPIARLLGNAPIIQGQGECYGVEVENLDRQAKGRISEITAKNVVRVVSERQGDLLVFLPGAGEIREVQRLLGGEPACRDLLIAPLFGNLTQEEQDRAILPDPGGRRRIILATSIAETSLTIEGITCVVDSGWSRLPRFEPGSGLSKLTTVRVSKAVAEQRAGRAGRLGPGYCLRLWTVGEQHSLLPFHPPEITAIDLAPLALELALWGTTDPGELNWLDPPRPGPLEQARELLRSLGALDESHQITPDGRLLAALPIHPRLGHMLLKAGEAGQGQLACDIAALLSERDILQGRGVSTDLRLRLALLELWRKQGPAAVRQEGGDPESCRRVDQAAGQWRKFIPGQQSKRRDPDLLGTILVHAYPDRIGRRRPNQRDRYLLASGRGADLPPADPLAGSEYLVAAHLDAGSKEGRIFLAGPLEIAELRSDHPELFSDEQHIYWDQSEARVVSTRRQCVGQIIVEESPLRDPDPEAVGRAVLDGVRLLGLNALLQDKESDQLQARAQWLCSQMAATEWPDLSDRQLLADLSWLEPYLLGISKAEQLKRVSLLDILKNMLGWDRLQILDREAPATFTVPSGSKIRIEYRPDEPPVLAVRIQEMFGLNETPSICRGKIPLLLHLLSPAQRPIQVTSDLPGFWQRGYPEIKKELKGRYPKHYWPDDPLEAEAVRGVKRKK